MIGSLGIAHEVITFLKDSFLPNDGGSCQALPAIATRGKMHLGSGVDLPKIAAESKLHAED